MPRSNAERSASMGPEEGAAFWFARMRGGPLSGAEQEQYDAWRSAVPENAAAMASLRLVFGEIGALAEAEPIAAARSSALRRGRARSHRRQLWAIAAVIALSVVGLWGATTAFVPRDAIHAETLTAGVGQVATATLSDMSNITLDADTELQVRFSKASREIVVKRGRAYFEVAHDADRPFVVKTAYGAVRATGTAFSVSTRLTELEVVLLRGGVRVSLDRTRVGSQPGTPINMLPGSRLSAGATGWTLKSAPADSLTAWRHGFVVFDATPLAEAVADMNAYSRRKIVLADGGADRAISGTFRAGQQEDFASALAAYGVVSVQRRTSNAIYLAPRKNFGGR